MTVYIWTEWDVYTMRCTHGWGGQRPISAYIIFMSIQGPSQAQLIYIGNKHILELEQGRMDIVE